MILALFFAGSGILSAQQDIRVFPGQYVITTHSLAALGLQGDEVDSVIESAGVSVIKQLGGDARLVSNGLVASALTTGSKETVPFNPHDDFCPRLIKEGLATSCSPDFEIKIAATPNDPQFSSLWGLSASSGINAPGAWDIETGSDDVVVAVIDTGVDYNHPDLKDNMWVNPGEIANNGIDDDNNGYIDDVYGINALGTGAAAGNPLDDNGHGSHCAGTIGGVGNNGIGVVGVAWRVKIMALKFLSASGSGSLSGAIETINYMVMMKNRGVNVRISSNSWGGGGFSQSLFNAIKAASDAGIIFVAAAGNAANDNDVTPGYPASYDVATMVSVAAIDSNQNLASFSNYGATSVDIGAPGVGIYSTYKNGGYATLSGTSMATPHVSGALALLLSANAGMNAASAIQRTYESAVPRATLQGVVKTGRSLNASRALRNQTNPVPEPTPAPLPCEYSMEEIAYAPDYSADSAPIINQTDEFGFASVNLPFSFPFHRDSVSQVTASPNGVLYTKAAPTSMDYKNAAIAPEHSIAALHTDLKATANPYGVRYAGSSNKAVFIWRSQVYAYEELGDAEVRTVLYPSGIIDVFVTFTTEALREVVRKKATIGLTWEGSDSAATYAHNSTKIKRGTAVRFTPACTNTPPAGASLSTLTSQGVTVRGKLRKRVRPRQYAMVQGFGSGTGARPLSVGFDGIQCEGTLDFSIQDGYGELFLKVPPAARGYKRIQFSSGELTTAVRIKRKNHQRVYRKKFRKANSRRFRKSCTRLLASVAGQ